MWYVFHPQQSLLIMNGKRREVPVTPPEHELQWCYFSTSPSIFLASSQTAPCHLSSFDTHARRQPATQSGRSRRFYLSIYLFIYFILLFCHTQWITSRIKTIINRLINIKFKICTLLGRSDCGGEISEKPSLWGIDISPHGQFKY